jgi:hypothetical protein
MSPEPVQHAERVRVIEAAVAEALNEAGWFYLLVVADDGALGPEIDADAVARVVVEYMQRHELIDGKECDG